MDARYLFTILLIIILGCAETNQSDETGTIILGLKSESSSLFPEDVKYFKLRIYKGAPSSLAESPFYTVPCAPLTRTEIAISHLSLRKDYTFVFEGYNDATCDSKTSLTAFGVRGEVEAAKPQICSDQDFYYLQVNKIDKINPFPVPPPDLNPSLGLGTIQCKSDLECQDNKFVAPIERCPDNAVSGCDKKILECSSSLQCLMDCTAQEKMTGESYCVQGKKCVGWVFHPSATCGSDGICRLTTLYPLNSRMGRVFHLSLSDKSGNVINIGGAIRPEMPKLTTEYTEKDKVVKADIEGFDPTTGLFTNPSVSSPINGHLFGSMIEMKEQNSVLLIGGATSVRMKVWETGQNKKVIVPALNPDKDCKEDCPLTFSKKASWVNLDSGSVTTIEMKEGFAIAQSSLVYDGDGNSAIFLRPGLVKGQQGISLGASAYLCGLDGNQLKCNFAKGSEKGLTPRGYAAGVCLVEKSGVCKEYLVLGGAIEQENAKFAELFKDGVVEELKGKDNLPVGLWGATAIKVSENKVITIGGTGSGDSIIAKPYLVTIDKNAKSVDVALAKVSGINAKELARVYMTVTPLSDGNTILVAGGIGSDDIKPLNSAILLSIEPDASLKYQGAFTLTYGRMGHTATLIKGGVLRGAVLFVGGLKTLAGVPQFADGAEIFLPKGWGF